MKLGFWFSAAVVGFAAASITSILHADTLGVTTPANYNGNFVFTNNGSSASFSTISGGAPATFSFASSVIPGPTPSDLQGALPVHIFLSATTSSFAQSATFGPFLLDGQPIDSGKFQVLLDTPINGMDNLLTANFQDGTITGFDGNISSDFTVQDGLNGGIETYTSDFLNFSGTNIGNTFQLAAGNVSPELAIDGNFLANSTEDGIISFGYDSTNESVSYDVAAAPLPSTALSALTLMIGMVGFRHFKRTRDTIAI